MRQLATDPPEGTNAASPLPTAHWPRRMIELGRSLRGAAGDRREQERAELWMLLNLVMERRIRAESRRTGPIGDHDLEDLAAEKALDLMNKLDTGEWNLESASTGHVVAFVSAIARNGLIDLLRRQSRRATRRVGDVDAEVGENRMQRHAQSMDPAVAAERAQFVAALTGCAGRLRPVHRKAWFFRVFLDMPSKVIARHPEVQLKASHVDVILQRCRDRIRDCMRNRGFAPEDIPLGVFTDLWMAFRLDELTFRGRSCSD